MPRDVVHHRVTASVDDRGTEVRACPASSVVLHGGVHSVSCDPCDATATRPRSWASLSVQTVSRDLRVSALLAGALAAGAAVCGTVAVHRIVETRQLGTRSTPMGLLRRTAWGRELSLRLQRAGIRIGAELFVAAVLAAALVAGAGVWRLLGTAIGGAGVATAVLGAAISVVVSADRRFLTRLVGQLPAVSQQLSAALGAGLSLSQAIDRAAATTQEPIAPELARMSREIALGARVDDVLTGFAARYPSTAIRLMVSAIIVQRSAGGDLASGLMRMSAHLDERARVLREARSVTVQARMSAWLVAGLPLVGGVIVELASPGSLADLLSVGFGRVLLLATLTLEVVGVVIVRRIAAFDGEDA